MKDPNLEMLIAHSDSAMETFVVSLKIYKSICGNKHYPKKDIIDFRKDVVAPNARALDTAVAHVKLYKLQAGYI